MAYKSLRDFIDQLEAQGELARVSEPVSTVLEMTEIQTRLLRNGGPAVLFEKPVMPDGTISPIPCLANLFGTVKRVAMGVTLEGKSRTTTAELREVGAEGTFGTTDVPKLSPKIRQVFTGPLVLNQDYTPEAGQRDLDTGVADAIADVVETGNTMRAAGLEPFGDPVMRSEAVLIRRPGTPDTDALEVLSRRLRGVLVARQYVLMDYDVAEEHLQAATAQTPGLEAPTVSPLQREGWYAVRAMVPKNMTNQIMDGLYEAGARAILVSPIAAARL